MEEATKDHTEDDVTRREERALSLIQDRGGIHQSELWKELNMNSRTESRIASSLQNKGVIRREVATYNGRRTYFLQPAKKDFDFSLLMAGDLISPLISAEEKIDPIDSDILKGGVGKSALSMNLADRLAAKGHNILYIDLDPNGHITYGLGYDKVYQDREQDLSDVILDNPTKEPEDVIYETNWGFDFVPASVRLEGLDTELKSASHSSQRLHSKFLKPLMVDDRYDYCVMDGGGERSKVADNAFFASKQSIIPIEPGAECPPALSGRSSEL